MNEVERYRRHLPIIITAWGLANLLPEAVVFLLTGSVHHTLSLFWALHVEVVIMGLNLVLPVVVVRRWLVGPAEGWSGVWALLGWRWPGWRALGYGLLALLATVFVLIGTTKLFGPPFGAGARPLGLAEGVYLTVVLLTVTGFGEETMFRGYVQTVLSRAWGAPIGIAGAAFLFGLRHLPMDLHFGLADGVSGSAWVSRMGQLYGLALVLGLARYWAKSTWASWIPHQAMLALIAAMAWMTRIQ